MAPDRALGRVKQGRARVEIIAIGDELLLGDTIDTNGAWLGQELSGTGVRVVRRSVIGDDDDEIRAALAAALDRTGAAVCCGGLGPTPDDRTRASVAAVYGWPIEIDEDWVTTIRARFEARGMAMPEVNRVQAEVPAGAILFKSDVGTAPGLGLADEQLGVTLLLPGVPNEVRWHMRHEAGHWLRGQLGAGDHQIRRRVIRTVGLAESALAERIADVERMIAPLTLAFLPTGIGIDLRITSWGDTPVARSDAAFDLAETAIRERLGRAVYGVDREDLAALVGQALRERGLTIAVAESCTGGLLAKRLTDAAGASDFMIAGVVSYANSAKTAFVDVPASVIAEHGAVSEATATAMLDGIMRRAGVDCGISITGIAGPGGATEDKPVGTVLVGIGVRDNRRVRRLNVLGNRLEIRERSVQLALKMLLDQVLAST